MIGLVLLTIGKYLGRCVTTGNTKLTLGLSMTVLPAYSKENTIRPESMIFIFNLAYDYE